MQRKGFFFEKTNRIFDSRLSIAKNDLVFNSYGNKGMSMSPIEFIFSDSNGVYETYYRHSLEKFLEFIKEGKIADNLDKREQLMKIDENSNPVIFYYSYDDTE